MDEKYFMRTDEVLYALGNQYDDEPGRQGRKPNGMQEFRLAHSTVETCESRRREGANES
jgi:hypothetical protein